MHTRNRIMTIVLMLAFLTLAPSGAPARDREFDMIVHHIESYYHAQHAHGFILGFASLAVNIVRPEGVRNFKMAIFENQDFSSTQNDLGFERVFRAGLSQGWQPLAQVQSRRNGERTYLFARDLGKDFKLLIATIERNEAVVMQVKLDPEKLDRCVNGWVNKPRAGCVR
jgi:hypothetical protein